jgi:hypothetical protein
MSCNHKLQKKISAERVKARLALEKGKRVALVQALKLWTELKKEQKVLAKAAAVAGTTKSKQKDAKSALKKAKLAEKKRIVNAKAAEKAFAGLQRLFRVTKDEREVAKAVFKAKKVQAKVAKALAKSVAKAEAKALSKSATKAAAAAEKAAEKAAKQKQIRIVKAEKGTQKALGCLHALFVVEKTQQKPKDPKCIRQGPKPKPAALIKAEKMGAEAGRRRKVVAKKEKKEKKGPVSSKKKEANVEANAEANVEADVEAVAPAVVLSEKYDEFDDNLLYMPEGYVSVYSGMLYKTIEEYDNECKGRKYYSKRSLIV